MDKNIEAEKTQLVGSIKKIIYEQVIDWACREGMTDELLDGIVREELLPICRKVVEGELKIERENILAQCAFDHQGVCKQIEDSPNGFEPKPSESRNTEAIKMIENLILDGIKPYTKTNVGSILLSDIEKLAGAIFALTASIKDQECQQRVEGIFKKIETFSTECGHFNVSPPGNFWEALKKEEGI